MVPSASYRILRRSDGRVGGMLTEVQDLDRDGWNLELAPGQKFMWSVRVIFVTLRLGFWGMSTGQNGSHRKLLKNGLAKRCRAAWAI